MTARFLLHLRMWEAQNLTVQASLSAGKPSPMEFTTSRKGKSTRSLVDDLGEDPVQCAHLEIRGRDLFEGEIMDNFGEGFVPRAHQNIYNASVEVTSSLEDYV